MTRTRHHRSPLVVALLSLVLALGVGAGAATAGSGLTTKAVRRIAAKVVDQKAGKLEVRHAETADDAATLSGIPADRLQTRSYVYSLSQRPASPEQHYSFPGLPNGQYLVTYTVQAHMSDASGRLSCGLYPGGYASSYAQSQGGFHGGYSVASASAIVTVVQPDVSFYCVATAGTFQVYDILPLPDHLASAVDFVAIDTVAARTTGNP